MFNKDRSYSRMRDIVESLKSYTDDPETELPKSTSYSGAVHGSVTRIIPNCPYDRPTSKADFSNRHKEYSHGSGHSIPPKADSVSRESSRRSYHHSQKHSSRSRDSSRTSDQRSKRDSSKSKHSSRIDDYDSSAGFYESRDRSHERDSSKSKASNRRSHSRSRTDSSRSRATSDRSKSRSKHQSSSERGYASLRTCINEKSSAKDCFDFFMLTCYFPKAAALNAQSLGKIYRKDKLNDDWAIHGLWTFSYKYGAELEKKCANLISMRFDEQLLLNDEELVNKLRKKWFSLYKNDGYSEEGFWKHEFYEHGRCATRSKHVKDLKGYFNLTLKMFDRADLTKTLADGGFKSGTTVTWAKMYEIIKKKHGGYPKIEQLRDSDRNIFHAHEIKLFYDHDLKPMDCPGDPYRDPKFKKLLFHYDVTLRKTSTKRYFPFNS
ncbi:hypothetical protein G9C98_008524, partial [Cotesia typhae]